MKLNVTKDAVKWFVEEMGLQQGDFIRFYIKLYGNSATEHHNYSIGLLKDTSLEDSAIECMIDGITFYISQGDLWFIRDYDMNVHVRDEELFYDFVATGSQGHGDAI